MAAAVISVIAASPQSVCRQPKASTAQAVGRAAAILPNDPTPTITPASVAKTTGG